MFRLTVKVFNRHYENDKSYRIETVYCYDDQLGKWLAKPKTSSYELISYSHCR